MNAQRHDYTKKYTPPKPLPETGFVRLPTVLNHIPVSRTAWYEGVRQGRYPKPIKLNARTAAWKVEDIRALIERLGTGEVA